MAIDFEKGKSIELTDGTHVTVEKKFGEGGQGAVYLVKDPAGRPFALKWYTSPDIKKNDAFYKNLGNNISLGSPHHNFLWPLKLTKRQEGSFGYIMDVRPEGYSELGHFFVPSIHPEAVFKSYIVRLNAAINVVNAFINLHLKGFSYKDVNDGNFFINPKTGDVLICDNDNVTANDIEGLISGKPRYMAPEIVHGRSKPNINSDKLSLAIILYRIMMNDHPYEGKRTLVDCVTTDIEKRIYGDEAVFCWDKDLDVNRPTRDVHTCSIYYWTNSPKPLREMFVRALSRKAIMIPGERVENREWKKLLLNLRSTYMVCPSGRHDILADGTETSCPRCKTRIDVSAIPSLRFRDGTRYLITPGKPFYPGDSMRAIGIGDTYVNNGKKETALKNISRNNWVLVTPSGRTMTIEPGKIMPLRPGMTLTFSGQMNCEICNGL